MISIGVSGGKITPKHALAGGGVRSDPFHRGFVHRVFLIHVGDIDHCAEDFGFVVTCMIQNAVDLCQRLCGLLFHAKGFVVRDNA